MGAEFRVNTYTDNWQRSPDITTFADGSYLIVWDSYLQGPGYTSYYVAGQRYSASGVPIGGQYIIDGVQNGCSRDARVTALSDGGYAVTYTFSAPTALDPTSIYVRSYYANGTPRGPAAHVDTVPVYESRDPQVVSLALGGFMVFFTADTINNGALVEQIYGRRYDGFGAAMGSDFLVNTNVGQYEQSIPQAVTLASGNVMVVWHSEGSLPVAGFNSNEIRGSLFSSTGDVLRADFSVGDAFGGIGDGPRDFTIGALRNGGFAVTYYEVVLGIGGAPTKYNIVMQFFDASSFIVSPRYTAVSETGIPDNSSITQLETGEILIAWDSPATPFTTYADDVRGRLFDTAGNPLGDVFQIAEHRLGQQEKPRIVALAGGGFVITYQSQDIDPSYEGIAAREFGRATAGNDVAYVDVSGYLAGLAGDDQLYGNALANTLSGGAGSDSLWGGLGADRLIGGDDAGTDYARYDDADYGDLTIRLDAPGLNAGAAAVGDTYTGIEGLVGGSGNDTMYGNGLANVLFGNNGSDFLSGGGGGDIMVGGNGNDTAYGGAGDDTMLMDDYANPAASTGVDTASGDGGNDLLWGYGGNDTLYGGDDNDSLVGNDFGSAVAGFDLMYGGAGNDQFFTGLGGNAYMDGGAGNDTFFAGTGSDTLRGGTGSDYLYGNSGVDYFQFYAADFAANDADIVYFMDAGDRLQFSASLSGALYFQDIANLQYDSDPAHLTTGVYITAFLTGGAQAHITVYGMTVASLAPQVEYTL
jgi:Ca2+-binding RTX toxin-like protein